MCRAKQCHQYRVHYADNQDHSRFPKHNRFKQSALLWYYASFPFSKKKKVTDKSRFLDKTKGQLLPHWVSDLYHQNLLLHKTTPPFFKQSTFSFFPIEIRLKSSDLFWARSRTVLLQVLRLLYSTVYHHARIVLIFETFSSPQNRKKPR